MANFIDLNSLFRDYLTYPNPCKYTVTDTQVSSWVRAPRTITANSNTPNRKVIEFNQSVKLAKFMMPYTTATYTMPSSDVIIGTTNGSGAATGTVPGASGQIGQTFLIGTTLFTVIVSNGALSVNSTISSSPPVGTGIFNTSTGAYTFTGAQISSSIFFSTGNLTITTEIADLNKIYVDVHSRNYDDKGLMSTIGPGTGVNNGGLNSARFVLTQSHVQFNSSSQPTWVHFHTHQDQIMRFARNEPVVINIMQENGYTLTIADTTPPTPALQTWMSLEVTPSYQDAGYNNMGLNMTQF